MPGRILSAQSPAIAPGDWPMVEPLLLASARADIVDDQPAVAPAPVGDQADMGVTAVDERGEDVARPPARRVAGDRHRCAPPRQPGPEVRNPAMVDIAVGRSE